MKNFGRIVLILLLSILTLSSCGAKIEEKEEAPTVTFMYSDTSRVETTSKEITTTSKITTTTKPETTTEKKTTTTTKPETTITKPETTTTTIKESYVAEDGTVIVVSTVVEPKEVYFVYKPSTHYVHLNTCRWATDDCKRISTTEGLEVRLCTECNPNIEVLKEYKETTTTTTAPAVKAEIETTITTAQEPDSETGYRLPYELSEDDWYWICKVVSSETGYCGEAQQKAVANTIFNRIIWANEYGNYNPFPKDVYGITHQKNQYDAVNYWRSDKRLQPGGELWNNTMRIIKECACEPDFTNGAIGYYNPNMSGYLSAFENNKGLVFAYQDGAGRFFKLNSAYYTRK